MKDKLKNQWERSNKLHYLRLSKGVRRPSAMEIQANYNQSNPNRLTETFDSGKLAKRKSTISHIVGKGEQEAFFKNDIINSYAKYN